MGIKDNFIRGTAWEFNDYGRKVHSGCSKFHDICFDLEKQLSEMPEYWKGYAADLFAIFLNDKINAFKNLENSMEQLGNKIKSNSITLEEKFEEINEIQKKEALENAEVINYLVLSWQDFWDREKW